MCAESRRCLCVATITSITLPTDRRHTDRCGIPPGVGPCLGHFALRVEYSLLLLLPHTPVWLHTGDATNTRDGSLKDLRNAGVGEQGSAAEYLETPTWPGRCSRLEQAGRPVECIEDELYLAVRWRQGR